MDNSTSLAQVGRSSPLSSFSSTGAAEHPGGLPEAEGFEPALSRSLHAGSGASVEIVRRIDQPHDAVSSLPPPAEAGAPLLPAAVLDGVPFGESRLPVYFNSFAPGELPALEDLPLPAHLAQALLPFDLLATDGATVDEPLPTALPIEMPPELLQPLAFKLGITVAADLPTAPAAIAADLPLPAAEGIAVTLKSTSSPATASALAGESSAAPQPISPALPTPIAVGDGAPTFVTPEPALTAPDGAASSSLQALVAGAATQMVEALPPALSDAGPSDGHSGGTPAADQSETADAPSPRATGAIAAPSSAAPSGTPHAGNPTGSLHTATAEFADRLGNAVLDAHHSGRPLRVRLHPPELGSLGIEVGSRDGRLTARLNVETVEARHVLLEHLPHLREVLLQSGHTVERIEVTLDDAPGDDGQPARRDGRDERSGDPSRRERRPPFDRGQRSDSEAVPEAARRSGRVLEQLDLEI